MKSYQVIEDNGGGLHLAVFEGEQGHEACIYMHSGYEYTTGQLTNDVNELKAGGDPINDGWEGNEDDPQAMYDDLTNHEYGWMIVADDNGIYPDDMGAAARREFGITED